MTPIQKPQRSLKIFILGIGLSPHRRPHHPQLHVLDNQRRTINNDPRFCPIPYNKGGGGIQQCVASPQGLHLAGCAHTQLDGQLYVH